jgi:hypothetical protein
MEDELDQFKGVFSNGTTQASQNPFNTATQASQEPAADKHAA